MFVQHFESGDTFLTFDPAKVREHYELEKANADTSTPPDEKDYGGVRP